MTGGGDKVRDALGAAEAAALPTPAETDGGSGLPADWPITPLGVNNGVYYFLDKLGQLRAIPEAKMGRQHVLSLAGTGIPALYERYPRKRQDKDSGAWIVAGWHPEAAAEEHIAECHRRGVFNPVDRVRGPGAWLGDGGELVLHVGDAILIAEREHAPGRIGRHIYPTAAPGPRPHPISHGCAAAAEQVLATLRTFNFAQPDIGPILTLGLIGAGMIGGALPWRPHGAITGGPGTGKTTLSTIVTYLFGGASMAITDGSAAGIWQRLSTSTVPVVHDELESEADGRRAYSVFRLLRQSASGGLVVRGGADHTGTEFVLRSVFIVLSILVPPLQRQDRSRVAILELGPLQTPVPPALARTKWAAAGSRLLRRLVDGWPRFHSTLECFRAALAARAYGARAQDTYGALLTCADLLLHDGDPHPDHVAAWCDALDVADMAERSDDAADELRCLAHLATAPIDPFRSGVRQQLGDWIAKARRRPSVADPGADPEEGNRVLASFGLKVVDRDGRQYLAVATAHQGLSQLFAGTHWAGRSGTVGVWSQALKRLPGAIARPQNVRFGAIVLKAVLVPADHVAAEPSAPAPGPLYAVEGAENV